MPYLWFAAGLLAGGLITFLWLSAQRAADAERLAQARSALQSMDALRDQNQRLTVDVAKLEEARAGDAEKLAWVQRAETALREAFQALAAQSLQTNAEEFTKRALDQLSSVAQKLQGDWGTQKQEIKGLVDPLRESLKTLDGQVQALEQKREGAYQGLKEQIDGLFRTQQQLQTATTTLAQALRSSSIRGQWGEVQLRRVVELAGMVEHVDFAEQQQSGLKRPDLVIHLPNEGVLPVDAKAPMAAYLEAMEAADEPARLAKLQAHASDLRQRIRELSAKAYWTEFEHSPQFVVMFVPNDSCLCAAFEHDGELLDFAFTHNVLLTTPVTLLALLKAVAYGWQQQQLADNAKAIADEGRRLHERLRTFASHVSGIGRHLNQTVESYNDAVGSMEARVLPSARRLGGMGTATQNAVAPERVGVLARLPTLPEPGEDLEEAPEAPG